LLFEQGIYIRISSKTIGLSIEVIFSEAQKTTANSQIYGTLKK